ncbi:ABC transporter permease [Cohnella faecalis]|uniref:ABC transporter permease n=1 Tax=Cohnella faecalis TaxID=2315694 RepID=A0A398CQI1_9BACL|nr:ABC transporter permease [Cohnella faecalis]RIE04420.1 ABC transporter permease [Cohnella faecalis]
MAIGVAAALLFHLVPWLKAAFAPLIVISQNIPVVAIGPLLIVWFGFGLTPKLILLVLVCFFPIVMSMMTGLSRSEPHLREYLAMIGASRMELLRRLELPASLPHFFTGLKITATYSVSTAVVVEWLGGSKGIGKYMLLKKASYDAAGVFASVIWVVALSLAVYGLVLLAERLVVRWTPRTGNQGGTGR